MTEKQGTIRKNLEIANKASQSVDLVIEAQIIESVRCLKEYKAGDPEAVGRFFEESFERPRLSKELFKICSLLFPKDEEKESAPKKEITAAILKSPIAKKALKQMLPHTVLKVSDLFDFRSACEAVTNGSCDYCVLPVSSSSDGFYPTFTKLVKAYDLKISAVTRVTKTESDEDLQFALLSPRLENTRSARYAVFSFVEDGDHTPSRVISALEGAGTATVSITASPLEYDIDRREYTLTVRLCDNSISAFLFFLNSALPGHNVLGLYQ